MLPCSGGCFSPAKPQFDKQGFLQLGVFLQATLPEVIKISIIEPKEIRVMEKHRNALYCFAACWVSFIPCSDLKGL